MPLRHPQADTLTSLDYDRSRHPSESACIDIDFVVTEDIAYCDTLPATKGRHLKASEFGRSKKCPAFCTARIGIDRQTSAYA